MPKIADFTKYKNDLEPDPEVWSLKAKAMAEDNLPIETYLFPVRIQLKDLMELRRN